MLIMQTFSIMELKPITEKLNPLNLDLKLLSYHINILLSFLLSIFFKSDKMEVFQYLINMLYILLTTYLSYYCKIFFSLLMEMHNLMSLYIIANQYMLQIQNHLFYKSP